MANSRKAKPKLQSCTQSLPGTDSIQSSTRTLVRSLQPCQKKKYSLPQILGSNCCFPSSSDLQLCVQHWHGSLSDSTISYLQPFPSFLSSQCPNSSLQPKSNLDISLDLLKAH